MIAEVICLSDYDIDRLNKGYSVTKNNIMITFEKGSKRYCEVSQ